MEAGLARPPAAPAGREIVASGIAAGLVAGALGTGSLMAIAEVAAEPTAIEGIRSSTWTPVTALASLLLGAGSFGGDFEPGPIALGLGIALGVAVAAGLAGIGLIAWTLGPRPPITALIAFGLGWALMVQLLLVNILANAVQSPAIVYEALPAWGWWLSIGVYGVSLSLLGAAGIAATKEQR